VGLGGARGRARLELLGAAALFSTGGAAIKASAFSALQIAGLRSLVAAAALALLVPESRRGASRRSALVALAYAGTLVLFVTANRLTTAANTIFLQSTAPLYLLALGPWLLKERFRRADLAFVALAAVGLALFLVGNEPVRRTATNPALGNALALASGVTWASTLLGLRWLSAGSDAASAKSAVLFGNLLAFVACSPWLVPVPAARATDWLLIAYLGLFQIGLAYALVTRAMKSAGAFEASLLLLLEPVLNPVWAWLVHREAPSGWALAGGVLVLLATGGKSLVDARAGAGTA